MEMSSISQMERWSSQTRILAMRYTCSHYYWRPTLLHRFGLGQFQNELSALARLRLHGDFGPMRLHDLVNQGQTQARSAFKLRLEWFKDSFQQLRRDARTCVLETELPFFTNSLNGNRDGPCLRHGAYRIFEQVPEYLLHSVAIHHGKGMGHADFSYDLQA